MSNAVPQCTHVKTNGEVCGSPAVSGTELCYHHSAVKTALARPTGKAPYEGFAPIPFVFPEDRASMQINFFLLLQAFNEQRIDQRTFRLMLSTLKAMAKNLGKTGSLVEPTTEGAPSLTSANRGPHGQVSVRGVEKRESRVGEEKDRAQPPAVSEQDDEKRGTASDGPLKFSPELMAKMEEIENLSPDDPTYAERVRAAVADGANELRAQGLDLRDISPVAASPTR
ncbi:MAG TPA: hypothetical protein VFT88_02000 [Acidobacteriaceae bacterium]|nr:hypothetical protein [Acidobacteriaceae bacterium]